MDHETPPSTPAPEEAQPGPPSSSPQASSPQIASGDEPRRAFFKKLLASVIGGVAALVPLAISTLFFLDPLRRDRKGPRERTPTRDAEGFIRVATTEALPADGEPRKFTVIADQTDAWNYFPNQRVGTVILRKVSEGPIASAEDVSAFSDICPHLGCAVEFRRSLPDEHAFQCPCHNSAFSLTGERSNEIPPRNLDRLDVTLRNEREIWVKYQKFRIGEREQIPIS